MESASSEQVLNPTNTIKLYKYRWIIILIFGLYSMVNFAQFMQISIIADILKEYYKVESIYIDMSGMVFMFTFIIFFLPIGHIVENTSLKTSGILSVGATAAGNALKMFATVPGRYYLILLGQTIVSISQIIMLIVPSKIASAWFGPDEVSTACAIGLFGTQIGVAAGAAVSTLLVPKGTDDQIESGLSRMFLYYTIVSVAIFLIVILFFRSKPPSPPSPSQALIENTKDDNMTFWNAMKNFSKNKDFLIVLLSFGIHYGIWNTYSVLLNQIYREYFPNGDDDSDLGILTFATVLSGGCIGCLIFGYILDKTHKFKLVSFIVLLCNLLASIVQTFAFLYKSRILVFIIVPIYGFFSGSFMVISWEYTIETTYPIPEAFGASVLNVVIYIFALVFTLILNFVFDSAGYLTGFIIILIALAIGTFSILFISTELKRYNANSVQNEGNSQGQS